MEGLERVQEELGGPDVVDRLVALSGSDFTTAMLEVARRRAVKETPATVLRRYQRDRFTRPSHIPWRDLRRAEDALLGCLDDGFDVLTLAPVVPLAAHSALGTVSQHKVLTAMRACEVAADPTNALALEAATRRAGTGAGVGPVRLAAVQRVVRAAQIPNIPGFYPHFCLLGLVTAGRDTGSLRFEVSALTEHLRFAIAGVRAAGDRQVQVALTPLSDGGRRIAAEITERLRDTGAEILTDDARQAGRGYYLELCFKVNTESGEIGDGGFTDWTAKLTSNAKERLLISGYGLDRLASAHPSGPA
ncbi:MAG TPA: hypothetical protein VFB06_12275 [Streptosporangiaceae bacterium]|nr:hypothetical protein [Streptosporangiaceae bacterium]